MRIYFTLSHKLESFSENQSPPPAKNPHGNILEINAPAPVFIHSFWDPSFQDKSSNGPLQRQQTEHSVEKKKTHLTPFPRYYFSSIEKKGKQD